MASRSSGWGAQTAERGETIRKQCRARVEETSYSVLHVSKEAPAQRLDIERDKTNRMSE